VEDAELRNILFSIQGSIAGFQNDMSDVKNDIADMRTDIANMKTDITNMKTDIANMKTDITNMKTDITNMKSDIVQLKGSVKTIELKLENEIDRKISALFDARMDELRYRKENKETREKVFELDMRVDNLEKAIMPA
jgi:chromosome segregation ATPase